MPMINADLLKKFAPVAAKEAPAVQPAPSVPQPVPVAPVARPFTDSETEDPDLATAREATLAARQRGQETRANLVQ